MKTTLNFICAYLFLMLHSHGASANPELRPPSFSVNYLKENVVFADFKTAHYTITYDLNKKVARVHSRIEFEMIEPGHLVFDLVPKVEEVYINKVITRALRDVPQGFKAEVNILEESLPVGHHVLETFHTMTNNHFLNFSDTGVRNRFDFDDYTKERGLLEQYLPANFEYDQFEASFSVSILGSAENHNIYANGKVNKTSAQTWHISYPSFYNASSIFFHIVPVSAVTQEHSYVFTFNSGRQIPVTVYSVTSSHNSQTLSRFIQETNRVLGLTESRLGEYPHDSAIVLMSSSGGGMEYAGATITDLNALYHEFAHFYFGRSVLSSSGASAWIDEAMASYISNNPAYGYLPSSAVNLASMSAYARKMLDSNPYTVGKAVVSTVQKLFEEKTQTGFDSCIKNIHNLRKYTPITTEVFKTDLEACFNADLTKLFDKYVYGKEASSLNNKDLPEFFPREIYNKRFTEY